MPDRDKNIGCPSIMTPSKMGKTKNLIFYSQVSFKCVNSVIFAAFYWQDCFVKNIITSRHWHHLNIYTPYENKSFNPRNQNNHVAFAMRIIPFAYRRVTKYAVTLLDF